MEYLLQVYLTALGLMLGTFCSLFEYSTKNLFTTKTKIDLSNTGFKILV